MLCPSCRREIPGGSSFCLHCGKPIGPKGEPRSGLRKRVGAAALLLVAAAVLAYWPLSSQGPPGLEIPQAHARLPAKEKLISGEFIIPAGSYHSARFEVNLAAMRNVQVVGCFHSTGGWGDGVEAVLAERVEFEKWITGRDAKVLYSTERITSGKVVVFITEPGSYYFALSNQYPRKAGAAKYVFSEIELHYLR